MVTRWREPAGGDELKPLIEVTGRVPPPLLELAGWIAESTARRWRGRSRW